MTICMLIFRVVFRFLTDDRDRIGRTLQELKFNYEKKKFKLQKKNYEKNALVQTKTCLCNNLYKSLMLVQQLPVALIN